MTSSKEYLEGLKALRPHRIMQETADTQIVVGLLEAGMETEARRQRGIWHDLPNAVLHSVHYARIIKAL